MDKRTKKPLEKQSILSSGKLPPQAIELEEAVIGAMISSPQIIESVFNILQAEAFYKDCNQRIFNAIVRLKSKFEPVDTLSVMNDLRQNGELEFVGGVQYLFRLVKESEVSYSSYEYNARIVQQTAVKRALIENAEDTIKSAFDDTSDVFEVLSNEIEGVSKISQSIFRGRQKTNLSILNQTIKDLGNSRESKQMSCGFPFLDSRLKLRRGQNKLVYIGARPSVGKSALISAMMKEMGKEGIAVGCFSLEMSAEDITNRMVVSELEGLYTNDSFVPEEIDMKNLVQVQNAIAKVKDLPIYYNDNPKSMEEISSTSQLWVSKYGVEVIFIDFIQKIPTEYKEVMRAVTYCSDKLQKLTKSLNMPIVVISSLNREAEKRNGRPSIADFRGSGDIESDADVVLMLWRPEDNDLEYVDLNLEGEPQTLSTKKLMVGDFAKNRNGKKDVVVWYHDLPTNNFYANKPNEVINYHHPISNPFPNVAPVEFDF